jgi:hypothetical protein
MIDISRGFKQGKFTCRFRTNGLRKLKTITIFYQGTVITISKSVKLNKSCVPLHVTFKT